LKGIIDEKISGDDSAQLSLVIAKCRDIIEAYAFVKSRGLSAYQLGIFYGFAILLDETKLIAKALDIQPIIVEIKADFEARKEKPV
jgi:hypothetical protein